MSLAFSARSAVSLLRQRGCRRVALVGAEWRARLFAGVVGADGWFAVPKSRYLDDGGSKDAKRRFDGMVIVDRAGFPTIMRQLEPYLRAGTVVVPADPDWVAARGLIAMSPRAAAWETTADTNYIARSALRGHYLEFGTFWGASFFPRFFRYRHWLKGRYYAFDSFAGLSAPDPKETAYTGGDFSAGAYACNQASFEAIAALVGMPSDRLVAVPGFFAETLVDVDPARYGLEPRSVSVCAIDCDLFEPTRQALDFMTPLLEDGALLYFDDWRLARASPTVGERAAALEWLGRHPEIELVEFHRDAWQHQWFIVQRRG